MRAVLAATAAQPVPRGLVGAPRVLVAPVAGRNSSQATPCSPVCGLTERRRAHHLRELLESQEYSALLFLTEVPVVRMLRLYGSPSPHLSNDDRYVIAQPAFAARERDPLQRRHQIGRRRVGVAQKLRDVLRR